MTFKKDLCKTCNIDGDCFCQKECQTSVNNCGMEGVVAYNKKINTRGQNYNNPDYVEFINDRQSKPTSGIW